MLYKHAEWRGSSASHLGKVYLVDDSIDVCRHTGSLLRRVGYDVETFLNGRAFLTAIPRLSWPAVVVLDMRMPQLSGIDLQTALRESGAPHAVVFLSGESERTDIVNAMKEGALDFLFKPTSITDLKRAIDAAQEIAQQAWHMIVVRDQLQAKLGELTRREKTVLSLIIEGLPNREIGTRLNLQAGTVKKHRASICGKFGVSRTSEIIALFRKAREHPEIPL